MLNHCRRESVCTPLDVQWFMMIYASSYKRQPNLQGINRNLLFRCVPRWLAGEHQEVGGAIHRKPQYLDLLRFLYLAAVEERLSTSSWDGWT